MRSRGSRTVRDSFGEQQFSSAVGWWGTWTLTLIVLALIGIAVADELAIAHPGDDPTPGFVVLAFGGPALFLLAQVVFHRLALGHAPDRGLRGWRRSRVCRWPRLHSRCLPGSRRRAPCSSRWRPPTRSATAIWRSRFDWQPR